jgi:hypothetical protein
MLAVLLASCGAAMGQASQPVARDELPEHVRAALGTIEDYSLNFDQPGFYELLEHMQSSSARPGRTIEPVDDLRAMIERPSDFRGRPVAIEGTIGRNSSWRRTDASGSTGGAVWQLELTVPRAPVACTVILTEPADDIPVGATIRVTGYFVMMRSYYDRSDRLRQAALVVAHAPTLIAVSEAREARGWATRTTGIVLATVALVAVWLLVRRRVSGHDATVGEPRATAPAPFSVADELQSWAHSDDSLPGMSPVGPTDDLPRDHETGA